MDGVKHTPEEIKKRLQRCKNNTYCDDCPSEYHCQIEADALAYIQQLEAQVTKWISVGERLPEKSTNYIVCTEKGSVYCTKFYKHSKGGNFGTDVNTHITHWMELPEPSKEE